jgi:hypothetical protein
MKPLIIKTKLAFIKTELAFIVCNKLIASLVVRERKFTLNAEELCY